MKEKKFSEAINFRRAVRVYDSNKKRIGFYSERLKYDSSVLRDRMGIISNLDSDKFEVFIFVTEKKSFSHDIIVFAFFNLFARFPHCLGPTQQKTMS